MTFEEMLEDLPKKLESLETIINYQQKTIDKQAEQIKELESILREYDGNFYYYHTELAGSWGDINKRSVKYFKEQQDD